MTTFLWILAIHLAELAGVLIFLLVRKNQKLEEIVVNQQEQLDSISILINKMDDDFKQLDDKMWIGEDQELQTIFREMKEVQSVLNSLK